MNTLIIPIACENEAFQGEGGPAVELASILRKLADRIEASGAAEGLVILDSNGNRVGRTSWVSKFVDFEPMNELIF